MFLNNTIVRTDSIGNMVKNIKLITFHYYEGKSKSKMKFFFPS